MRRRGFAEVFGSADERRLELVLVDVVELVGGGEDFGLVDEVDVEGFEDLCLHKMPDTGLGHDGDRDGSLDGLDHAGMRHAGDAAFGADHGGHALERHDGDGAGFLGDDGLLDVHDVHDDAAFEHLGEAGLEAERGGEGFAGVVSVEVTVPVRFVMCHVLSLPFGSSEGSAGAGIRSTGRRLESSSLGVLGAVAGCGLVRGAVLS